jgi:hypothetical protein
MAKVRGIICLVLAVAFFVFLAVDWDGLGSRPFTLDPLPPSFSITMRAIVVLFGLALAFSGARLLTRKREFIQIVEMPPLNN